MSSPFVFITWPDLVYWFLEEVHHEFDQETPKWEHLGGHLANIYCTPEVDTVTHSNLQLRTEQ